MQTEAPHALFDSRELFGRAAPLALDLGCGNGVFLSALARRQPSWNVLGIDKKDYRVRQARRRAADLPNARVVQGEATEVMRGLPAGSAGAAYLLFSDPWPKRRHAVRRLAQRELADLLGACLAAGGSLFFATDSRAYFEWARGVFDGDGWRADAWVIPDDWPATEFEKRFVCAGLNIHRFRARRA